jgi:hypothetical protein
MNAQYKRGFSTLEMLVAMTIIVLVLSAVLLLSFGNQSLLADSAGNIEALSLAGASLDTQEALARKDFNLVMPTSTLQAVGPITYQETVGVQTQSDFLTKKVTATVAWAGEYNRAQHVTLSVYITNFDNALSASTCNTELTGNWSAPLIANTVQNFAQLVGDSTGTYTLTGLDAYNGRLYVTASNSSYGKETFFIFTTATVNPTLLGKIDNDTANTGLAALVVASSTAGSYAYVASASSFARGQLQILDVSNAANPRVLSTYKIPTSTVPSAGLGNAIFYKDGYAYVGLTKTSAGGSEFNIIDVHNPQSPLWVGGYSVGNDINSIYVQGSYAYLASPNAKNIIVLDVSNKTSPVFVGSYTPAGGSNGERVLVVGDTIYLGRTYGTNELYLLNAATPASITSLGSKDIGTGSATSINGIVVRSNIAFLLTNTQLVLYNVGNPAAITAYATPLILPNASSGAALDCEGNTLYAASNDATKHGYVYVIQPGL